MFLASSILIPIWDRSTQPLPDTGQWLFLALNEKLPHVVVQILRARIIGLHHYLMLFLMLAFSVLFDSVKAPGLGLGARYMFTMAIGRLLRAVTFVSTILPSVRPWCAPVRFRMPPHPHPLAQKYHMPYASNSNLLSSLVYRDSLIGMLNLQYFTYFCNGCDVSVLTAGCLEKPCFFFLFVVDDQDFPTEYRPDWGLMSFLIDILRPTVSDGSSWYKVLKKAGGGCNDLLYSGHMLVAVLTAMAWTVSLHYFVGLIQFCFFLYVSKSDGKSGLLSALIL